jgi:hypothetical protein
MCHSASLDVSMRPEVTVTALEILPSASWEELGLPFTSNNLLYINEMQMKLSQQIL